VFEVLAANEAALRTPANQQPPFLQLQSAKLTGFGELANRACFFRELPESILPLTTLLSRSRKTIACFCLDSLFFIVQRLKEVLI
jgi:hypothetical protein